MVFLAKVIIAVNILSQSTGSFPRCFTVHKKYDDFSRELKNNEAFKTRFEKGDISLKKDNLYKETIKNLVIGAESRARHYTSSLVTMGFATQDRMLTESGQKLVHPSTIQRDELEEALPISNANMILLRQALRLRVYSGNSEYYTPFKWALYFMLKQNMPVEIKTLTKLVQIIHPASGLSGADLWAMYQEHGEDFMIQRFSQVDMKQKNLIKKAGNRLIDREEFNSIFINGKTKKSKDYYYEFYLAAFEFANDKNQENLEALREIFTDDSERNAAIKKAFGFNEAVFVTTRGANSWDLNTFLKDNANSKLIDGCLINQGFYDTFIYSKYADALKENTNTTQKVLEATGMFKTENGIVYLLNKDILNIDAIINSLENDIFGSSPIAEYEGRLESPFSNSESLMNIFELSENDIKSHFEIVREKYGIDSIETLPDVLATKRDSEFKSYIRENFSKECVFNILEKFTNRDNDSEIKKLVSKETDVPTIFEYIVGLAWYYLSEDKSYNLYKSFNLIMNGNFRPVSHAPGGEGDIIINYKERKLMIEVTLMNKQAQKRGEWEPVLRHSVNLSVESDKPSTTLFVADELDLNTINIWRAVAAVPLESSRRNGEISEDIVQIMPVKCSDLIKMSQNMNFKSQKLLSNIDKSFSELRSTEFDSTWRENILKNNEW